MRSAPYAALVSSIADQEPRHGWLCAMELPRLSAEDAALVCQEHPEEVDEGVKESLFVTALQDSIRTADVATVGLKYLTAVSEAARDVIWRDVQGEIERRESDEQDEYADAHPESPESAHGVGRLFL